MLVGGTFRPIAVKTKQDLLSQSLIKKHKRKMVNLLRLTIFYISGAAGNRTLVQTYSSKAFYMFIFELIVGFCQERNKPNKTLEE